MRAGPLDRRVTVQEKVVTQSPAGGEIEVWSDLYALWMGKRDVRAAERFAAQQVVAEIDTVFTARFAPALLDIRPDTHRLVYRGRVYNIHGLTELGRRDGVEIACSARGEASFGE